MSRILTIPFCLLFACTPEIGGGEAPPFEPDRPGEPGDRDVEPYTGSDPDVLDAQERMYTGHDLHQKVIQRSCSGADGVCHNQAEYPDMRTSQTFLATIGAPCNVNAKFYTTIFNRCEQAGDKLIIASDVAPVEIAYIDHNGGAPDEGGATPTEDSPGLHIYLKDPLAIEVGVRNRTVSFQRRLNNQGQVQDIVFTQHNARWWVLSPNHVMAEVPDNQASQVDSLLATGIREGDANRDGIFGAAQGDTISMLNPGLPEQSYLVGRLTGTIEGEHVPGTRMPLANLVPTVPDMLALMCFIEGLPMDGSPVNLSWPIDYKNCSYIDDPSALSLTGTGGPTWSGRVWPLLQANCGGCHGGSTPSAGLDLLDADTYNRLLGPSSQNSSLNFIEPGNPGTSYLWLKLTDDASINGAPMPQVLDQGYVPLSPSELADIEAWINGGALP